MKSHEWNALYELEMVQSTQIQSFICIAWKVYGARQSHTFHFAHLEGPKRLTLWWSLASYGNLVMHNIWHPSCIPFFKFGLVLHRLSSHPHLRIHAHLHMNYSILQQTSILCSSYDHVIPTYGIHLQHQLHSS